jgi:hypothetical protein
MILWDPLLQGNIAKHTFLNPLISTHIC